MKVSCHGENPRLFPLLFQIILELAAGQSPRKSNWRPPWWNLHFWERKNMSTQEEGYPTNALPLSLKRSGSRLNIKTIFPGLQIFIVKLRSWDCFIFIIGIPILVRWHLYIESGHRALIQYKGVILLYRKSHYGDKMVVRLSYLHNGISYTVKMTSLYWISPQCGNLLWHICLHKVYLKYIIHKISQIPKHSIRGPSQYKDAVLPV